MLFITIISSEDLKACMQLFQPLDLGGGGGGVGVVPEKTIALMYNYSNFCFHRDFAHKFSDYLNS